MEMQKYLKGNVPEYFQSLGADGKNALVEYLNAAGSFLEETREAINHFQNSRNSYEATIFNLDGTLSDHGFKMPRNFSESKKRLFLRDIVEIIKKNGTADWIKHVFGMIGVQADVMEAWISDPINFKKGFVRDLETGDLVRKDLDIYAYEDFVYGAPKVYSDGVMFEGYKYSDYKKSNPITNIPIFGEKYSTPKQNSRSVAKTPYLVIRLLSDIGDVSMSVDDYVDEDGNEYFYTSDEKYQLALDIIDYFLTRERRPTTVKIVVVAVLHEMFDEMEMIDHYLESGETVVPQLLDVDNMGSNDFIAKAAELTITPTIGSDLIIGLDQIPYYTWSVIPTVNFTSASSVLVSELNAWDPFLIQLNVYLEQELFFSVRPAVLVSFINTTSEEVSVYGSNSILGGKSPEVLIESIIPGAIFDYITDGTYQFYRFIPTVQIQNSILVSFEGMAFNQEVN